MAICFEKEEEKEMTIKISNGHLEKLKKITGAYKTKGDLYTIAFLLDIAEESKGEGFTIDGKRYLPSDDVKNV